MNYIKRRISSEYQKYKQDTSTLDKIVIWVTRALMFYSAYRAVTHGSSIRWLICVHVLGCFPIEMLHLLTFEKSFFNKISYSLNAHAGWFMIVTSFFSHCFSLHSYIPKYDWVMHTAAGLLSVYIGFYVVKPLLEPKTKSQNQLLAFFGFCFANFGIVFWEIFEFVFDFFLGSNNQRFDYVPNPDLWLFKIIGFGKTTEAHLVMFDTMFDCIFAFVGAIVATYILYFTLSYRLKKKSVKEVEAVKEVEFEEVGVV